MLNIPLIVWQFYCLVLALFTLQLYMNDPLVQQWRQVEGILRKY